MTKFNVAVIVGSNRRESVNRLLAQAIVNLGVSGLQFSWIRIDDMPIYNADLEGNRPEAVTRFTEQVAAADGVLFVTPEHNRSLPAALKSAIDWGSKPNEKNVWRGMPIAITGTSPGALGTALCQMHLRQILGILGALVMGGEAYISFSPGLLDANGNFAIETTRAFLHAYMDQFCALVGKLRRA
jgi:chromate reductase